MPVTRRTLVVAAALLALGHAHTSTQRPDVRSITTPEQQFGASIGDDYFLATYAQFESYWQQLDRESDRMALIDMGRTEEGRTQWMAVITAPENFARLDRYREISRRLAYAEDLSEFDARSLAREGKTVVWISGGLHATEVLSAQQLIETSYQLVSGTDLETTRILRDVIVLLVHANPDGHELVANWYMREKNPRKRTFAGLPRLYQKYVGHDNNRDFYMGTQVETVNMNRVLFHDWVPQIVYDHHQAPSSDAVMVAPPFGGPSNYLLDPLVVGGIGDVGASIHQRFEIDGKRGVRSGNGLSYSLWWNGGLRTTATFHNQIGILTETIGSPTPVLKGAAPVRFRQAVDYSVTANRAVLDAASRDRARWLFDIYRMGRNSIARGSGHSWTVSPHRPADSVHDPGLRDARGYVIPANQPDFLTATKFVNALIGTGVAVHRAVDDFTLGGRKYPSGSYVVKTAQAFRPHILDMFEPQDHPDGVLDEGGPPRLPYDNAGWTLAFQMGVRFDRVLDGFDGPFEKIVGRARPVADAVVRSGDVAGYLVSHRQNDAVIAVNRLLNAGEEVFWLSGHSARDGEAEPGMIYVPVTSGATSVLEDAARELGLAFTTVPAPRSGPALQLHRVRIGLVDRYGGWSTSGWIRWLLEQYEFPFEIVYPPALDKGDVAERYDVIVLPSEAVPNHGGTWTELPDFTVLPPHLANEAGQITRRQTLPALKNFVEHGGTLLAIGRAAAVARELGVPVSQPLSFLPTAEFLVPGSVVRVAVDNTLPVGYGLEKDVDVVFNNSPVFRVDVSASVRDVRAVAWFATESSLRSGWALGEAHLKDTVAVVDAALGKGRVLLFGPEITFRGQSHGTFKFLFNGIHYARAAQTRLH